MAPWGSFITIPRSLFFFICTPQPKAQPKTKHSKNSFFPYGKGMKENVEFQVVLDFHLGSLVLLCYLGVHLKKNSGRKSCLKLEKSGNPVFTRKIYPIFHIHWVFVGGFWCITNFGSFTWSVPPFGQVLWSNRGYQRWPTWERLGVSWHFETHSPFCWEAGFCFLLGVKGYVGFSKNVPSPKFNSVFWRFTPINLVTVPRMTILDFDEVWSGFYHGIQSNHLPFRGRNMHFLPSCLEAHHREVTTQEVG